MKMRILRRGPALLLTLLLLSGLSAAASAKDPAVAFEDGRLIVFAPGSVYTDTDLFDNFKGLMPGDVRTEEITVSNNAGDYDYMKVYMRAVLHDEEGNPVSPKVLEEIRADGRRGETSELGYMHDFLSQLSLSVRSGASAASLVYDSSPDKLDGLEQPVFLAALKKGESLVLTADLSVPADLGSEYAYRIGEVDWEFIAECYEPPPLIQTGQLNWPIPMLGSLGTALMGGGFYILFGKRKKNDDEEER